MARTLTDRGLPYYDTAADSPDGATQQQDLVETADDVIVVRARSNISTRGDATLEGKVHVAQDTKAVSIADGVEWIELHQVLPITKTSSFTLDMSMAAGRAVETHSSSAIVVTVPANATVAFPIGSVIEIDRIGSGSVTIAPAGGVVIRSSGGRLAIGAQFEAVTLRKRAADEWVLVGALS